MLADHNSLIVPARDAEVPAEEKKLEILGARDTKVSALQQLGLYDAWGEVHNLHSCYSQDVPPGFTYGHSIQDSDRAPDRSKRRIHVCDSLKGHLSTAFTSYLRRLTTNA